MGSTPCEGSEAETTCWAQKRKEKTVLLSVVKEKLMVKLSLPLA